MAKIHRKRPPKHLLIPDTNILWYRQKDVAVSPEFTEFWINYGEKYEIELTIPEVVKGELLYQHTSSALKSLERANKQFHTLTSITNKKYSHRVSEGRVQKDVETKINNWIKSISANIYPIPLRKIDWNRLINDAIWRRSPFTEEKDSEKGFRDALILETTIDAVKNSAAPSAAFITGDELLRTAAIERSKGIDKLTCYESLEEFVSVLRLMDEELTAEFVKAIQNRARVKFNSNSPDCLLNRESITSKIRSEFSAHLDSPATPQPSLGQFGIGLRRASNKWDAITEEGVWIRPPSFVRLENENEYI